jgi:predicted Zn finger-like uncharacterized protein
MLLNCKSCKKKFIVPDGAITNSGRLVQCGSCGNKWTQFPVVEPIVKKNKINKIIAHTKKIKSKRKLYTAEYLKEKHGLVINKNNNINNKNLSVSNNKKNSFGFYGYLIIFFVFLIALFGILELIKELLVSKYPFTEIYIDYLYEVINIIRVFIAEFLN